MESIRPLVSLCIPTDGTVRWVIPTIESIYAQKIDFNLFEVVITDNGKTNDLSDILHTYKYPNLKYYKSDYTGFTNQIYAMKQASGEFRKMLNHRSCILPGKLQMIIDLVNKYKEIRPVLYFSDGKLLSKKDIIECNNYDEMVCNLNIWTSWSSGMSIWDNDVKMLDKINPDSFFPHIALMLDIRKESQCIIWNENYQNMIDDAGKGSYNLFQVFSVTFPNILLDYVSQNKISKRTYEIVKRALFSFLTKLYYREVLTHSKHNYDLSNIRNSMTKHYSSLEYYQMISKAVALYLFHSIKKIILYNSCKKFV